MRGKAGMEGTGRGSNDWLYTKGISKCKIIYEACRTRMLVLSGQCGVCVPPTRLLFLIYEKIKDEQVQLEEY